MTKKTLETPEPIGNQEEAGALSDAGRPKLRRMGKRFEVAVELGGGIAVYPNGRTPWDALQAARAAHPDSFRGWCTACGGTQWEPSWDGKGEHPPHCTRCNGIGSTTDDRVRR